ncbi:MAG: hypothetical protein ACRD3E_13695 [Terriglobales bacterium]
MKRVLLMLAATAAFACTTAVAQAGSGTADTGMGAQNGSQTTTGHHKKGGAMGDEANGKSGKMSSLTGCLSASPNSDGMYTLSNGRYKSGVEVGPTDKVKDHAGHQVALKGHWGTAGQAGENSGGVASSTSEKGEKHFDVDSVKHISETCKEAPGGGTMGHNGAKKHKGANSGTGANGSATTPPPTI